MRPNSLIVRSYLLRGARLWLATRILITGVLLLSGFHPFRLSFLAMGMVVVISALVCLVETYRHKERALLGNLGVGAFALVLMFVAPAILGETSIAVGRLVFP